ncbi:TPA: hypothetical protein ACQJO4_002485 [Vibrio parahaemolyticus]
MKKFLMVFSLFIAGLGFGCVPATATAGTFYGSAYVDSYDWTGVEGDTATAHNGEKTSIGMGIDGGYMGSVVNVYGFYEEYTLEDRFSKVMSHISLGDTGYTIYGQASYYGSHQGDELRGLVGVGKPMTLGESLLKVNFSPFIGYMWTDGDFGIEGSPMFGWSANTKLLGMSLTSWHEMEYQNNKVTHQGALGAFYDLNDKWFTGMQYRYWSDIGGNVGFADALIMRVGMKF